MRHIGHMHGIDGPPWSKADTNHVEQRNLQSTCPVSLTPSIESWLLTHQNIVDNIDSI